MGELGLAWSEKVIASSYREDGEVRVLRRVAILAVMKEKREFVSREGSDKPLIADGGWDDGRKSRAGVDS